jgi:hypothetical protein
MVINAVGHLAEAAWHHPDISASYGWVEVRLMNHAAKGVTDKDFELAAKIEEVVAWQPAREGGALTGTPADARFAISNTIEPDLRLGDALPAALRDPPDAALSARASHSAAVRPPRSASGRSSASGSSAKARSWSRG